MMKKMLMLLSLAGFATAAAGILALPCLWRVQASTTQLVDVTTQQARSPIYQDGFEVQVLVDGHKLEEYYARGRTYVEAQRGAEYEIRIRNPLPVRIAVALSVDGLNSIDARRTTASNASKWVIRPYESITVGGWQVSSERARRFYFTTEEDSYAAKLGQASNVGLISAVFFRERSPITIVPAPRPGYEEGERGKRSEPPASSPEPKVAKDRSGVIAPPTDDDYAATGIGRSVDNEVRWTRMELDSRPIAEFTIRYEYYSGLVRLGIRPRPYAGPDIMPRRERATGFEDRRFSPEP